MAFTTEQPPASPIWSLLADETLAKAAPTLTASWIGNYSLLKIILIATFVGGSDLPAIYFNGDQGINYSLHGFGLIESSGLMNLEGSSGQRANYPACSDVSSSIADLLVLNISTSEKIITGTIEGTTGLGGGNKYNCTAVWGGKWYNTTDPITSINVYGIDNGYSLTAGSRIIVLGRA